MKHKPKTTRRLASGGKTKPELPQQPVPQDEPGRETVLLAVVGMSPAILTETIWALAHQPEPVIPHRVIAVTTTEGRERLATLFAPADQLGGLAPWDALRQALTEHGLDLAGRLRFGVTGDDIRVITAAEPISGRSTELPDIRNRADNEAAADFILEQVRSIVENPDTHLIASLAGGRKTMSALLYACLTLIGRETDRLTHVLVSEPFETLPGFWFPDQPGGPIPVNRSAGSVGSVRSVRSVGSVGSSPSLPPSTATVELADVPFVPLRNLFQRELGGKPGSFLRLVDGCRAHVRRRAAEHLRVSLDVPRAELEINGQAFKLAPAEMLVMLFLARRAKQNEPAYAAYKDAFDDLTAFRAEQVAAPKDFNDWRHADSLRAEWREPVEVERFIVKAVSGLRDKLRQRGGDAALLAACLPEKGRCSLDIPGSMIHIK